jgi:hypothetical protein
VADGIAVVEAGRGVVVAVGTTLGAEGNAVGLTAGVIVPRETGGTETVGGELDASGTAIESGWQPVRASQP